jgi:hypothetical protein
MDDNVATWLFTKSSIFNNKRIDHVVELAQKESDETKFVGIPDMSIKRSKEMFLFLTGRISVGEIESTFDVRSNDKNIGQIILKDQIGEYSFDLTLDEDSWSSPYANTQIFKKAYLTSEGKRKESISLDHHSFTSFGKLKTKEGISFTMVMEYNLLKHPRESDLEDENGTSHIPVKNPDLNHNPKYANVPYEIYILKDQKKTRVFGPSAYWIWWFSSATNSTTSRWSSENQMAIQFPGKLK